jgi:hypothetical protein
MQQANSEAQAPLADDEPKQFPVIVTTEASVTEP